MTVTISASCPAPSRKADIQIASSRQTGPVTSGSNNLSATNSRPVSRPSKPAATSISSAATTCLANIGREMSPFKLPTNGSSSLKDRGSDRSCRRPSASVT